MPYKVTVRYGSMGLIGAFTTDMPLRRGDKVVLRSERGNEPGEIVHPAEEIKEPAGPIDGEILRSITPEDEKELRRIDEESIPKEIAFCRDRIKTLDLPMKLVDAEHLLGGEKIIFYFLADGRVDFRQLVKDIAREYKTRIELRQIGVRDEARLLAELGHCGQCLCCRSFMKSLEPVTMRMAKSQKATLDPTKISGVCGRLMCCLRYEDKVYSELKTKLPKRGSNVVTRKAAGKVIDTDILAQVVSIKTTNSNIVRVHISDIVSIEGDPGRAPAEDGDEAAEEAPKSRPAAAPREAREPREPRHGGSPDAPRPGGGQQRGQGQGQQGQRPGQQGQGRRNNRRRPGRQQGGNQGGNSGK